MKLINIDYNTYINPESIVAIEPMGEKSKLCLASGKEIVYNMPVGDLIKKVETAETVVWRKSNF